VNQAMSIPSILQCPVCRQRLERKQDSYRCANNHTFDLARQSYVNLLLSNEKHSKEPGDSAEMIQSRRRFLFKGYYEPVAEAIDHIVAEAAASAARRFGSDRFEVLDAGCGEGYYLKRLKDSLGADRDGVSFGYYGLDISKPGIRYATQYDKSIVWIVGSVMNLPFLEASLDVVESIFANTNFGEFSRVLKDGGKLLLAYPGPHHLASLRRTIYEQVIEHSSEELLRQSQSYFSLLRTESVTYNTELNNGEDIKALLLMTPFYWNINLEKRRRVESLLHLPLEVDIRLSLLEKMQPQSARSRS
jgi:23S rRNA (guanine745-N1)-methyltransferase